MKLAALANAAGDRAAASKLLTRVVDIDAASPDGKSAAALSEELRNWSGLKSRSYCSCFNASSISRSLSSFVMFF